MSWFWSILITLVTLVGFWAYIHRDMKRDPHLWSKTQRRWTPGAFKSIITLCTI